jgi:hypothetical protein
VKTFDLKPLTSVGIPKALEMASHYRLLNEPGVAESICRDVLLAEPDNAEARKVLLLALTDMFPRGIAGRFDEALALGKALPTPYQQAYYVGIVYERRAKAHHRSPTPARGALAYEWIMKAMDKFAEAGKLRDEGDDDALLRWNNCVRRLQQHADLRPDHEPEDIVPQLGE